MLSAGKRAPATGHELVIGSIDQLAINPGLFRKMPYDPVRDFVPVADLYRVAFFVGASQQSALRGIPDLIALAKAGDGKGLVGCRQRRAPWRSADRGGDRLAHAARTWTNSDVQCVDAFASLSI